MLCMALGMAKWRLFSLVISMIDNTLTFDFFYGQARLAVAGTSDAHRYEGTPNRSLLLKWKLGNWFDILERYARAHSTLVSRQEVLNPAVKTYIVRHSSLELTLSWAP